VVEVNRVDKDFRDERRLLPVLERSGAGKRMLRGEKVA
jgi:hypothetical protein